MLVVVLFSRDSLFYNSSSVRNINDVAVAKKRGVVVVIPHSSERTKQEKQERVHSYVAP